MARPSSGSAITVETAATSSNTTTVSATTQTMRRMPSPRHSRLPQAKRAYFGRRGQYRMDRTGHFSSHRNEARNVPGTGRGDPTDAGPVVVPAGDGPSLPRSTQMALARMRPATGRAGTARSWPSWTVLALLIGLWAASVALGRAHGPLAGVPVFVVVDVVTSTAILAWTVVGAVIVSRRPSNRIGWLLCAAGLLILLGAFALHYALATLLGGWPSLPGGGAAAWLAPWTTVLGLTLWFWLLLLFPDGPMPNPLGWEAAGEVLRPVNAMAQVVATALLGAAAVSIVLRLRRVGGVSV